MTNKMDLEELTPLLNNYTLDVSNEIAKRTHRLLKKSNISSNHRSFEVPCKSFNKEQESVGELATICSQIVVKCLCMSRIGRPVCGVSKKWPTTVRKWTNACDKRLARLISYIHYTNSFTQYCHVRNAASNCRPNLFQNAEFESDLADSKSTSGKHAVRNHRWDMQKREEDKGQAISVEKPKRTLQRKSRCKNSPRASIPYFRALLHLVELVCGAKKVEHCLSTTMLKPIQHKCWWNLSRLSINP